MSDPFYQRFVTQEQNSLILGSSRSAQGLVPSVINDELEIEYRSHLFNYSFTVAHSPYGEVYSKSIFEKLTKNSSGKGLFVLSVDPWTISSSRRNPDDIDFYIEKDRFLGKLITVNGFMNLQYMLNYFESSYYDILLRKIIGSPTILHKDGWLEIDSDKKDINYSKYYSKRLKGKISEYRANLNNSSFSNSRFQSLLNLVRELQKRGDVYLVRIPVDEEILEIENELMPEFDSLISGISKDLSIPFLDLSRSSSQFKYTDGNHLDRESARKISLEVAEWIKGQNMSTNRNENSN